MLCSVVFMWCSVDLCSSQHGGYMDAYESPTLNDSVAGVYIPYGYDTT